MAHTEAELSQAIQSMFRVRGVESPAEANGDRTIWHRGAKGADLVTWLDPLGKVTRQELYLFEDCLVWEKGVGLKTGSNPEPLGTKAAPAPPTIAFDAAPDGERLRRARSGLQSYAGDDKCLMHVRSLIHQATRTEASEAVTLPPTKVQAPAATATNRRPGLWLVLAGAALVALGAWLLLR